MKEFDIIIEGEHISCETRSLCFGELQANPPDGEIGGNTAFDSVECSKWFRLDTVNVYVVGYDDNGDSRIVAQLYKNGQIIDDGFVQASTCPESCLAPLTLSRRSRRQCAAGGEFHDEDGLCLDRLRIYKGMRTWDDGKDVACLVGFEYDGEEIILADETDPGSFEQYIQETRIVDGQSAHDAFKALSIANGDALGKEYIEVEDRNGETRGFYRIGYEQGHEDEGVMICVESGAHAKRNSTHSTWMFPCRRVKEWKVVPSSGKDEYGEYIAVDPEVRHVTTVENSPFWFDICKDVVWEIDEEGNLEEVGISGTDKNTSERN